MLNMLVDVVDEVVLTRVSMARSAAPGELAGHIGRRVSHRVIDDARQALGSLLGDARPEDIVLVAGSLYLLGEVRPVVQEVRRARLADATATNSAL
jgi:folylpolyglutamate synthase/dihydropteroate synthase